MTRQFGDFGLHMLAVFLGSFLGAESCSPQGRIQSLMIFGIFFGTMGTALLMMILAEGSRPKQGAVELLSVSIRLTSSTAY